MSGYHRTDARSPLAFLLASMLIGYLCERLMDSVSPWPLLGIAVCFWVLAMRCTRLASDTKLWIVCFLLSGTAGFWAYAELRSASPPSEAHQQLPAREVDLSFQIQQIYTSQSPYNTSSGIGQVVKAPPISRLTVGDLIYFQGSFDTIELIRGQVWQARGILEPIARPTTDEETFDRYLRDSGIYYRFERLTKVSRRSQAPAVSIWLQQMNHRLEQILHRGAPENAALHIVYTAILLGKKDALAKQDIERYQLTGTMHFFAISGLHIGVIATVIAQALFLLRVPRKLSPCIGLPLLLLYVLVTGAEPSAMRAFLMTAFFWAAMALNRQRAPIPALIASAVVVLLIAPAQLWSIGFQLSYVVVLNILLLGLPMHQWLKDRSQPYRFIPKDAQSRRQQLIQLLIDKSLLLFAISLSAWLGSAPITATLFGFVAPIAIFLNIFLVHLVGLIICTGVISLSLGLIGLTPLSEAINHAAWLLIDLSDQIIDASLGAPLQVIQTEYIPESLAYCVVISQVLILMHLHTRTPKTIQMI